jgi:hypothetical protein
MSNPEKQISTGSRFVQGIRAPRDGFTIDTEKILPKTDSIVAEFSVNSVVFGIEKVIKGSKVQLSLLDGDDPDHRLILKPGGALTLGDNAGFIQLSKRDKHTGGTTLVVSPIGETDNVRVTGNVYGNGNRVAFDSPIIK